MDLENFCGFTQQEHIPCTLRAYKNHSHIGHVHPHRCRNSHSRKAYFTLCGLIPPSAQRARPSSSLLKFSQQEHIPCTLRAYKNPSHIGHVHPHRYRNSHSRNTSLARYGLIKTLRTSGTSILIRSQAHYFRLSVPYCCEGFLLYSPWRELCSCCVSSFVKRG